MHDSSRIIQMLIVVPPYGRRKMVAKLQMKLWILSEGSQLMNNYCPSVDPAAAASSRGRPDPAELWGPDSSGSGHGWHQDHVARLCFQGNRELSSSPAAGSMAGKHWSHPASAGEYQTSKSWDVLWVSNISHQTSSECQTLVIRHLVSVRHQS